MSVCGMDVGASASCVALARKRGIDVLLNAESVRETPAMVSFGDKQRYIGVHAAGKVAINPKNTPFEIKRLLGRRFKDPQLQRDLSRLPFKVSEAPGGGVLVHVRYNGEDSAFTPEQLMAMVIVDLKKIAEKEGGAPVYDCALSVPVFYTEPERRAMLAATQIAGLNCLRLVNETTATALAYGIYKTDLPETDAVNVAFVDMGHASTELTIVAFKRGGLVVRAHAWDRDLGGRDLDDLLFDALADDFKTRYKIDVRSNAKASFKLRLQCEKLKKTLSANPEAPLNVECIMDDVDVRAHVSREQLEEWAAPGLERLRRRLQEGLAASGLSAKDISSVEVVGSGTRVPAVYKVVEDVFGAAPSRTLNSKEVVSRGCALQCAMLSPTFKVRDFEVVDAVAYPIVASWEKDGGERVTQTLFERGSAFPATKSITFLRAAPFAISLAYAEGADLPEGHPREIGTYTVGPFKVPEGADKAKIKVRVTMNLHGLASVEGATLIEETVVEEPAPAADAAAPAAAAGAEGAAAASADGGADAGAATAGSDGGAGEAANGPTPMEADAAAAAAAPAKKVKVKKTDVPVAAAGVPGLPAAEVARLAQAEGEMQAADKLQEDTQNAKNALESYVYALRSKLYEGLAPYVREGDRDALAARLSKVEDWLYEDGEDETKSVYVAKLQELKALGDPIEARAADDAARPAAAEELRRLADGYLSVATSELPAHAHLSAEERATLQKEAADALAWLQDKTALQSQLARHDESVLTTADIQKKAGALDRACKPIASKPPPAPKPAPKPAAAAADAGAAAGGEQQREGEGAAPMDADGGGAAEAEGEGGAAAAGGGEPMEEEA
ncbi:heat shock protein 70 kDa-like [Raphidocelis subcapitata]|uniref:Heat shock protein 70 kDa-like n=1 Tax=Raphidocelis subcapitata TaxID=307507 RepID=A0A2V0NTT8_9CHLO|nr:heat shock protein 70 kDa-like [Raphidocelis subcapitata]|eukprot:GBF90729.1 heat shock protein 70 kDa-like [Raphidocelis subcapitata]